MHDNERQKARENFAALWRKSEKSSERMGGSLLILTAGIIMVIDKPADELTMLAIALTIAGGLTLIFRSGRPNRKAMMFISAGRQAQRAVWSWMAALLAFWQGFQMGRGLFWVAGGLLLLLGFWFNWRARKLNDYDDLFTKPDNSVEADDHAEQLEN